MNDRSRPDGDAPSGSAESPRPLPSSASALRAFEAERRSTREVLHEQRAEAIERREKAIAWLMTVGFGPAAIIAILLALFVEGSRELAIGFGALGAAVLALRAWRAHREIQEIEAELEDPMDGS